MELRHLRYFKAFAEALNFTKAATRLHVAQPALSRQIADLEYELGVALLKRSAHGVALTAEGKLFLEDAKEILSRAEDARKKVRATRAVSSASFTLVTCRRWNCEYCRARWRS